ncbi:MAG: ATP-dependent Clp protease ATP-binding subunit [Candidatus Hydrogenedentes bacterium]|nr:ATP-dependent Clp protease ATP-binding subunit [Candidatus Hydrogenedentota bacterium]
MQVPVSQEVNALLDDATSISLRRGQMYVGVEHLFEAILIKSDLLPLPLLNQYGEQLRAASHEMTREQWKGQMPIAGPEVFYTPRCAAAANQAAKLGQRLSQGNAGAGHLLLAILADALAAPSRAMDRLQIPRGEMLKLLRHELMHGSRVNPRPLETQKVSAKAATVAKRGADARDLPDLRMNDEPDSRATSVRVLESLTRDLTQSAALGSLEPAIGRDRDIVSIAEILSRKTKNNVILVGEAGVGKTHIVEGLALAAFKGGKNGVLAGYRFLELNMASLMAGTQYRGAFEEKLLGLLEELRREPKSVLFIDEIHLIMGAGTVEGAGTDLANLLKPALARGELRCVGATTLQEYRKFIEKDPAIERRFQMLRIDELSAAATWEVLSHLRPGLQRHHGVYVGRKAMQASIALSQRYMPNRQLPDKAIDVLDQACARYRLKSVAAKNMPKAFDSDANAPIAEKVTPHDVRKVISRMTGIPIEEITQEERVRLTDLERKLRKRIIGQEDAVARTVAAVKKARAGLADPNRPEAVMLFLGPTGVGKTQLAKSLANMLYGSAKHLITFDMSEYVEEHSVSRLLGAPPGYVGSEEEGRLSQAVRNAPFSILLFDEIEKAHRRIFDIFLPILDEGRMKDARGRDLSFRNCIIIFTSNIGADHLHRGTDVIEDDDLMNTLRKQFRPEFINRIDEIVPFYPLLFEDIRHMLKINLGEMNERLKDKGLRLRVFQGAYEHLAKQGYSVDFGARELRRTVERLVMNPISSMVLENRFTKGDTIEVLIENDQLTFRKGETLIERGVANA